MAKPKTSYTPVAKPASTFTKVAKNVSTFTRVVKNAVSFTGVNKNGTTYNRRGALTDPWFMGSTFLQLDNTHYLLNGYGSIPSELDPTKLPTSYTAV